MQQIERIQILTAKTQRARREDAMNRTREEIEQTAELVVDAILKVHRALGPGLLESTYQVCLAHRLPRELERPSDQGRHQANGQWVMSGFADILGALGVFAVNFWLHTDRVDCLIRSARFGKRAMISS